MKVEIVKPTFPAKFDLQAFNEMKTLLAEKKYIPLKSLHMSAYNPPSSNRKLVGDLLYLRVCCFFVFSRLSSLLGHHSRGGGAPHH